MWPSTICTLRILVEQARSRSGAARAPRSPGRTPRSGPSATGGPRRSAHASAADCADAGRTARRASRPPPRTVGTAAGRVHRAVRVVDLREAVDQRAPKPQLLDAALHSRIAPSRSCSGRAAKPWNRSGRLATTLGQRVVGAPRELGRLLRVGDRLDRRRIERQDHHLDAVLVHQAEALVVEVEQAVLQLRLVVGRHEAAASRSACPRSRNAPRARSCPAWSLVLACFGLGLRPGQIFFCRRNLFRQGRAGAQAPGRRAPRSPPRAKSATGS